MTRTLSLAVLLIFGFSTLATSQSEAEIIPAINCHISNTENPSPANEGWPRNPDLLPSLGSPKILILAVDFPDGRFTGNPAYLASGFMDLNGVHNFYKKVSQGLFNPQFEVFPEYVTLSQPSGYYLSTEYIGNDSKVTPRDFEIIQEAILKVAKRVTISNYSAVMTLAMSGPGISEYVALARPGLNPSITTPTGEVHNIALIGKGALQDPSIAPYRIMVHEINHLLGLADLYLYQPNGYWQAKSTGAFGQMSYMQGDGSESLAWNRWLRQWIPDSRVVCLTNSSQSAVVSMESGSSRDADSKLAVIKLAPSAALSIEAVEDGILVYKVDASVPNGHGPVTIIPKETALTRAPLSPDLPDWVRFSEATLGRGDSVLYQNILIQSLTTAGSPYTVSIYIGDDAAAKYKELQKPKIIPPEVPVPSQAAKVYAETLKQAATSKKTKVVTCTKGSRTLTIKSSAKCPPGYKRLEVSWSKS